MRIKLSLFLAFLPLLLSAQERFCVKGRVVNGQGEAVEYVQVGVPRLQIGTISTVDGRFEIEVPCDTLEFFHVSYRSSCYPVTGPADDVLIVLQDLELPPAVSIAGKTKEKYLVRPGMKILGDNAQVGFYQPGGEVKGLELGSIAKTKRPFLVQHIMFAVLSNYIPGCVAAIRIYRMEGAQDSLVNVLHKPIYVDIPESVIKQEFDIRPEDPILLDPGRYYIGFQIVDTDEEASRKYWETPESERDPNAMYLYMPLYLKGGYQRDSVMGEMKHFPVNVGISVKGLEY